MLFGFQTVLNGTLIPGEIGLKTDEAESGSKREFMSGENVSNFISYLKKHLKR